MCKFRPLNPDEVELRVDQTGKANGRVWARYLIYKDARVDQRLLDETVGPLRWQKSYEFLDGKLYCTVSIRDDALKTWVSKQDVGTESNTEKVKGEASDAFKRACFCWGLGRELYTAPKNLYIDLKDGEYSLKDGKIQPKGQLFKVTVMDVDDDKRIITRLVITDNYGNVRFEYPGTNVRRQAPAKAASKPAQEYRQHPTTGQLESMAKRIAMGENLTDKIQTNFLMSQGEWLRLDELIKEHQSK